MKSHHSLVDLRIYTIALRKMPEFLDVFDRLAMPVLLRAIGRPIGMHTTMIGSLNQFVHLWGYESLADYEARGALRDSDPEWPAYLAASGRFITAQENRLMRAVTLSSVTIGQPS